MKKFGLSLFFILFNTTLFGQLYLNEFMASNSQTIADELGEYDDWIEIFNKRSGPLNLRGFYLTDDFDSPTKWALPEVIIPGNGFLLIWADGSPNQGKFHADFKLSAGGEELGLYDGQKFVDSLKFGNQRTNISFARFPDGGPQWRECETPTPGASNNQVLQGKSERPQFSSSGGFYSGILTVALRVNSSSLARIHYTLDSSEPTENSARYTFPIVVDKTTIIRARTFESGFAPSEIVTHTYFINKQIGIATVSLVTEPKNLWDPEKGIYMNPTERGDNWERPISIECFDEQHQNAFRENAGIRISGEVSREYDKKSFRIYFRGEYGQSWLRYQLFPIKNELDQFKRIKIHSGSTDMPKNPYGNGWTMLRDPLMYELGRRTGCIFMGNRPAAVFLNGEPWGIYNVLERIDEHFIETNFGETNVDLIENSTGAKVGDMMAWQQLITFFENQKFSDRNAIQNTKALIDLDNFTNYCILEIFGGNHDWPHHNMYAFRPKKSEGLWRWILWDMDGCFGPYGISTNTLQWATREHESTLILRRLLENESYRLTFINRFADLLNSTFKSTNLITIIDSLASRLAGDIRFETERWGSSYERWKNDGVEGELKAFARQRPDLLRNQIKLHFNLQDPLQVILYSPQGGNGSVRINSIRIQHFPWQGQYFRGIPIELEAIPAAGYKFSHWSDASLPRTKTVSVTPWAAYSIYPVFERTNQQFEIVINEINYNSDLHFDPEDWIELHNVSDKVANIAGWHFKDSNDDNDFVLPAGTQIKPGSFLVLCRNAQAFHQYFPAVNNYIGDFDFGLSNQGDLLRLYSAQGELMDSVKYDDYPPWPTAPDGDGPTLELIDPALDNARPENWQASLEHGTPGQLNSNPNNLTLPFATWVNCGSPRDYLDLDGRKWQKDQPYARGKWGFIGGRADSTADPIENTEFDPLFQAERVDLTGYCFDVPNDNYIVLLLFAEIKHYQAGKRIFHVEIEKKPVLTDFDIFAELGHDYAFCYPYMIGVRDGQLNIQFTKSVGEPKISAIGVYNAEFQNFSGCEGLLARPNQSDSPASFTLHQNYPNPFNKSTIIRYELPFEAQVRFTIFNTIGQSLYSFVDEPKPAGGYSIAWSAQNQKGVTVPSGVYFYQLEVIPTEPEKNRITLTKKMSFDK